MDLCPRDLFPVSSVFLICVSHLSDSGPTADIIKVSRRVMTQLGQGRSLGTLTHPGQGAAPLTGFPRSLREL